MASGRSDRVQPQLDRLFRVGAVGTMSDAQLLDRFATRRDAAGEAAFEELVIRHGPMVLRITRSVLHHAHDAEDAFQAVFLILANRAGSIRRKTSLASWLFGVAQRVATRARRSAARRRLREQRVASRSPERTLEDQADPDWAILHEEIDRLPERLRAPIALCYLEGLSYTAAAQRLGVSEMAVRGRLARARERLCRRLARRGVTASAGLLAAGAARQVQAAVPVTLIQSTIRIALGFVAGNTAAVLARGVLTSMLMNHLRVATIVVGVSLAGSYSAWQAVAAGDGDERAHDGSRVPTVQVIRPAARKTVKEVGQPSFVESSERTPIHSRVPGYVEKVLVDIGDRVKAGDVLATVLVPPAEKRTARKQDVRRAEQRIELARKELEQAEADVAAARARLAEAKAIVLKYQAEVDRWDTEVKRLEREVKRGVVDEAVLRESTNEWKARVAARDAAQATIAKTKAELRAKEAAVAKAKFSLSMAEADLAGARSGPGWPKSSKSHRELPASEAGLEDNGRVTKAQARLAGARELVARDERDADRWDVELTRLRRVPSAEGGPDAAQGGPRARDEALAAIQRAEATLRSYRATVSLAEVEVAVARAALAVARSGQRHDEPPTRHVTLTAPHDGLVVARSANTGDAVKPASDSVSPTPLFVIDRVDKVRVAVETPEDDARYVRVGTKASVVIKGYRDEPVEARVARTSWTRKAKSRVLRAEIELPNPDGRLLPGMYAFAKVFIERPGVRALPLAAVTSCGDRSYCWILKDGRAAWTEIKTGTSDGKWVEVERRAPASDDDRQWAPFDGSEQVILGDVSTLRDNAPVRVDRGAAGPE